MGGFGVDGRGDFCRLRWSFAEGVEIFVFEVRKGNCRCRDIRAV